MEQSAEDRGQGSVLAEEARRSLRGYYWKNIIATLVSQIVVSVLDLSTPMNFITTHFSSLVQDGRPVFTLYGLQRSSPMMMIVLAPLVIIIYILLRPISKCLRLLRQGQEPSLQIVSKARQRLLNVPFLIIPTHMLLWITLPGFFFGYGYLTESIDSHSALVLWIRTAMVGLIATAFAFFSTETQARKTLIPLFFPQGRLVEIKGAARQLISRRIRAVYRLSGLVPMAVLVVTLITLALEVNRFGMETSTFALGVVRFSLVLFAIFFLYAGVLSRLVSRSIVEPLEDLLGVVEKVRRGDYESRVRVVSNDEIGALGDSTNTMIEGLAEREVIRSVFGRYVSPEIRDEILSGRIPLEGELREATVLFADLRDFTPLIESLPPKEAVKIINGYFQAMDGAIRRHHGLILHYIGDAILAVFGVPLPRADHPASASHAALEMCGELEKFNAMIALEGRKPLRHGIGLNTGLVLAANIGSHDRVTYSLVGDTVNVASRIQDLTKDFDYDILLSETTRQNLGQEFILKELPATRVKGKQNLLKLYALLG
ncbi:MAG: adenylate/guanylate cyclase domain-containing protein [Deltaproteobacteria bacterium]|nr:adenylate/guanylate cyclase domain-containing protein [Deltaproteobacteria bacterium]